MTGNKKPREPSALAYTFIPIATLHTCFAEKFGIPRQMNLAAAATGRLVFHPRFSDTDAVRHLEGFSHVWLVFVFHRAMGNTWSPMVRPPRLGGNKKVGVFASRSPFRPNSIGISAVKLETVEHTGQGPVLHLSGVDILDGTPILDIKPYVPWADTITDATGGFAAERPSPGLRVVFSAAAREQSRQMADQIPDLAAIITQVLQNDPRPGYQSGFSASLPKNYDKIRYKTYGIRLFDVDVKWQVMNETALVLSIEPMASPGFEP